MGALPYWSPSEMAALRFQAQGKYPSVDRQQGLNHNLGKPERDWARMLTDVQDWVPVVHSNR
jgi:hypothetical protein